MASSGDDCTIRLWSVGSGRLLLTLTALQSQSKLLTDWIASTPRGYYAASPSGEKYIRWRVGDKLYPAARYRSTFHRPDLVQMALRGG